MARQDEFSYKVQFGSAFAVVFLIVWCTVWTVGCLLGGLLFPKYVVLHALVGAAVSGLAVYLTASLVTKRRTYGYVRLDMAQIPYVRGEQAEARIVFPRELPNLHVDLELRCFRRNTVWERDSSGESSSRETREYLFRQALSTHGSVQGGLTCFPVTFVLPSEHPAGTNGTARGWKWRPTQADGVVWQLEVKGPDFTVELELPAFEVADPADIRRPA